MHRAQIVGEDLQLGGRAELPGVQDALAEYAEDRQHALEGRAATAGEDRDVTRRGAVTAARYRTLERMGAARLNGGPPGGWVLLISSQMLPGASPPSTPSAPSMTSAQTLGEGRQVITTSTASASERAERAALAPRAVSAATRLGSTSRTVRSRP